MSFSDHARRVAAAFSPASYRKLSAYPYRQVAGTAVLWIVFCVLLSLAIGLPQLLKLSDALGRDLAGFDKLEASIDAQAQDTVQIGERITVDLTRNATVEGRGARLLITSETATLKQPYGLGTKTLSLERLKDMKGNAGLYGKALTALLIALLPAIAVLLFAAFLLQGILIVTFGMILGLLVTRIIGFRITARQLATIFTATLIPLAALQLIPLWYLQWWLAPVLLYVVFVVIAIIMTGESKVERDGPQLHVKAKERTIKKKQDEE